MKFPKKELGPMIKEIKFSVGRLKKSPLSIVGIAIIIFFAVVAILAPVLAPPPEGHRDPYVMPREGFSPRPMSPSETHPWGTVGNVGQWDIYYGCIWGTRVAFYVGLVVVSANLVTALFLGSVSGYYGGAIDEILMRLTDIIFAFPGLILIMAFVVARGRGLNSIIQASILVGWAGYTRVMRGEVLALKSRDYIEAARAAGCSSFRIIVKHILPNAIYPLLIIASLDTGAVILTVAALGFLGLGPQEGFTDWGSLINMSRGWIVEGFKFWWTWTIPGIFIFMFVLGWNLLGDAFRDILDPTLRRR